MSATVHRSRAVRATYLALGFTCLGLGLVGVFVPLLPTTVFMLVAAFFFARSSERWHEWMLQHPRFGPVVRDYQAGLGIPRRVKALAVVAVVAAFGISLALIVESWLLRMALAALAVAIAWFIVSRPTTEVAKAELAQL